jgi:hypothetical protein
LGDADAGREELEGGELKEIEALLAAAHGDLCTCLGADSVAARGAQAALGRRGAQANEQVWRTGMPRRGRRMGKRRMG